MTHGAEWAGTVHQRIAAGIKHAREVRKMSAQQLADETEELGYPITRSQIANYESGRKRGLDVAELLALAAVLNTSPVALMYPSPSDELSAVIEVLPGVEATEFQAAQWFSGHRHVYTNIADPAASAKLVSEFRDDHRTLGLWRELSGLYELRRNASHVRKGDELSDAQIKLIEGYDGRIAQIRFELGLDNDA